MFDLLWQNVNELLPNVAAWLLIYLLHSTILLGSVWFILHIKKRMSDNTRELLWRFALLGGIFTATLQTIIPDHQLRPRIELSNIVMLAESEVATDLLPDSESAIDQTESTLLSENYTSTIDSDAAYNEYDYALHAESGLATPALPDRNTELAATISRTIWLLIIACGVLAGLFFILYITFSTLRFLIHLRDRVEITHGSVLELINQLKKETGTQLNVSFSCSNRIRVPIAFGIIRKEICIPGRVLTELSHAQQKLVLAHELAHLRRHDPLWQTIIRMIEWILFVQPLNRVAGKSLRTIAEFQCDSWAARHGGDGLSLAKCLTDVAKWLIKPDTAVYTIRAAAFASTMADKRSNISLRVERLIAQPQSRSNRSRRGMTGIMSLAILAGIASFTPVISDQLPDADFTNEPDTSTYSKETDSKLIAIMQLETELDSLNSEISELIELSASLQSDNVLHQLINELKIQADSLNVTHMELQEEFHLLTTLENSTTGR